VIEPQDDQNQADLPDFFWIAVKNPQKPIDFCGFCLVQLNKAMDIYEIRKRTAYEPNAATTQKNAVRSWLTSLRSEYQFAVTLTLKQYIDLKLEHGINYKRLVRGDCDRIAQRFIQKLNRQAFGKAAERYGKALRCLVVVEGERTAKQLHFHLAVGGLPKHYRPNQFTTMVKNAVDLVRELDAQHDVQIMDSGWTDYITKELGRRDTDNVLWHLA
jgi:hypothetical protein